MLLTLLNVSIRSRRVAALLLLCVINMRVKIGEIWVSHNVSWCLIMLHGVSWSLIMSSYISGCLMVSHVVS